MKHLRCLALIETPIFLKILVFEIRKLNPPNTEHISFSFSGQHFGLILLFFSFDEK